MASKSQEPQPLKQPPFLNQVEFRVGPISSLTEERQQELLHDLGIWLFSPVYPEGDDYVLFAHPLTGYKAHRYLDSIVIRIAQEYPTLQVKATFTHCEFEAGQSLLYPEGYTTWMPERAFETNHLENYIQGLNLAIAAGVDVRFIYKGKSVPAIRTIVIDIEQKCLAVWYRIPKEPCDQHTTIPISTPFTTEFNDLPNDLRATGWK